MYFPTNPRYFEADDVLGGRSGAGARRVLGVIGRRSEWCRWWSPKTQKAFLLYIQLLPGDISDR